MWTLAPAPSTPLWSVGPAPVIALPAEPFAMVGLLSGCCGGGV